VLDAATATATATGILGLVKQLLPVFGRRLIAALPDSGGKLFLGDSLVMAIADRVGRVAMPVCFWASGRFYTAKRR